MSSQHTHTGSSGAFLRRLELIPAHGLGLSVDVYQPDLTSLLARLGERQVWPGYLEIFRASQAALAGVRRHIGGRLAYHGEGVWLTEPGAFNDPLFRHEVRESAAQVELLGSAWLNHECATKHMAGYSFGTYLPPLYTRDSAAVVAENTAYLQQEIDRSARASGLIPALVLLEMPPLTYFVAGTLPIPTFFRFVTDEIPCGLVLDIGHLWTVYRYSGAWRRSSLQQFVADFLDEFPLERTVQIHVAGLAVHASGTFAGHGAPSCPLPAWLDAHAAPIPSVLFELLDQVLDHPRLKNLKGLALEVDTKQPELIIDEMERFTQRYAAACEKMTPGLSNTATLPPEVEVRVPDQQREQLNQRYATYARIAAGMSAPGGREWTNGSACIDELPSYHTRYLPYEIMHWGGELTAMFPRTCEYLSRHGMALTAFVPFWCNRPTPLAGAYDFFTLKIDRFVDFVREQAPGALDLVLQEAADLRRAYAFANEPAGA